MLPAGEWEELISFGSKEKLENENKEKKCIKYLPSINITKDTYRLRTHNHINDFDCFIIIYYCYICSRAYCQGCVYYYEPTL